MPNNNSVQLTKDGNTGKDKIVIDGKPFVYNYSPNVVTIIDSYKVSKKFFKTTLKAIKEKHPDSNVWYRSISSLKHEWACHNLLYSLGMWQQRTKDVDLNYPNRWGWLYWIVGAFALIFIK